MTSVILRDYTKEIYLYYWLALRNKNTHRYYLVFRRCNFKLSQCGATLMFVLKARERISLEHLLRG